MGFGNHAAFRTACSHLARIFSKDLAVHRKACARSFHSRMNASNRSVRCSLLAKSAIRRRFSPKSKTTARSGSSTSSAPEDAPAQNADASSTRPTLACPYASAHCPTPDTPQSPKPVSRRRSDPGAPETRLDVCAGRSRPRPGRCGCRGHPVS